jgi:hypothetical protein
MNPDKPIVPIIIGAGKAHSSTLAQLGLANNRAIPIGPPVKQASQPSSIYNLPVPVIETEETKELRKKQEELIARYTKMKMAVAERFFRNCYNSLLPAAVVVTLSEAASSSAASELVSLLGIRIVTKTEAIDENGNVLDADLIKFRMLNSLGVLQRRSMQLWLMARSKGSTDFLVGAFDEIHLPGGKINFTSKVNEDTVKYRYSVTHPVIRKYLRLIRAKSELAQKLYDAGFNQQALDELQAPYEAAFQAELAAIIAENQRSRVDEQQESDRGQGEGEGTASVPPEDVGPRDETSQG